MGLIPVKADFFRNRIPDRKCYLRYQTPILKIAWAVMSNFSKADITASYVFCPKCSSYFMADLGQTGGRAIK